MKYYVTLTGLNYRFGTHVRENAVIPIYPEDVDCTDEMDLSKSMALRIDNDYKGFWNR